MNITFRENIKGLDYSEIENVLNDLDFFKLDNAHARHNIKLVRLFIRKLLVNLETKGNYKAPIVKGLSEVKDDFTFIQWTNQMKEGLWV